ncbi:MAG: substrate-binding domain-containing protein [Nitrososphaeria archaeon]|jgi:simple sugar transport system substrate-binding protein
MSQEPKKVERRNFLNYAVAIIATGVVVGAGVYLLKPSVTSTVTSSTTSTVAGPTTTVTGPTTTVSGAGGTSTVTTTVSGAGGGTTTVPTTITATIGTATATANTYTIWMADHGEVGSSFWAPCYKGVQDAINQLAMSGNATINFKHTYTNEDYAAEATDLQEAVASKPDGILMTVPSDPTLLDATVRAGVAAGIPFIDLNANDPRPLNQQMPYLYYVGENSTESGVALAMDLPRWIKANSSFTPSNFLLCNPVAGHVIWEARLQEYATFMTSQYPGCTVNTVVTGTDTTKVPGIMTSFLTQYPKTDMIVMSGGSVDVLWPVLTAAGKTPGPKGNMLVAAFDPTTTCMTHMSDLSMANCFDQQQYLQGWIPMWGIFMDIRHSFALYGTVATGPFIINELNVATVMKSSTEGFR